MRRNENPKLPNLLKEGKIILHNFMYNFNEHSGTVVFFLMDYFFYTVVLFFIS